MFNSYSKGIKMAMLSSPQIPINVGDIRCDPLFKYGFGLTY
jgi:hypothetical protein